MIKTLTRCKDCISSYVNEYGIRKCEQYGVMNCMSDDGFCEKGITAGVDVSNLQLVNGLEAFLSATAAEVIG